MSYKFARRSFLRAAGGSAGLLLPLLRSIEARAQGMAAPLRLLIIQHPLGCGPGLSTWRPNASATTTSFTLPLETAPFAAAATPLQKYMCMIDGLNVVTPSGQNTHEGGMVAVMTGVNALGKGTFRVGSLPLVDHYLEVLQLLEHRRHLDLHHLVPLRRLVPLHLLDLGR